MTAATLTLILCAFSTVVLAGFVAVVIIQNGKD